MFETEKFAIVSKINHNLFYNDGTILRIMKMRDL